MVSPTALLQNGVALAPPAPARRERTRRRERRRGRERPRRLTARRARRVAVLFLVGCIAGGLGYLRAWPPVATVMSASMSPTIDTGDLVVMKRIDGTPRVGDVVAVSVPEQARTRYGYPPEVIHRIVRIAPDGRITTKGDARSKPDPFTTNRASVKAEVVATLPAAGRVLTFLTSTLGLVWLAAGLLLFLVMPVLERQRENGVEGIDALRSDVQGLEQRIAELTLALEAEGRGQAQYEPVLEPGPVDSGQWTVAQYEPVLEPEPCGQWTMPQYEPVLEPEPVDGGQWTVPEPEWEPEPELTLVVAPEPEPALVLDPEPATPAPRRRRSGGLVGRIERWANSPAANRYR
jgi:signal peptidase I